MRTKHFTLILLTISLILMVSHACKKKEYNCPPPEEDYVDSYHYWLFRHHVGDSLTFNVYRVETVGNHHVYHFLREETFVGVDSGEVVEYDENEQGRSSDGCLIYVYNRHQLCITFKSDRDSLKYMIRPFGSSEYLKILFKNIDFRTFDDEFNFPEFKELLVENVIYKDAIDFTGYEDYDKGIWHDSSVAFINYDDGLIKFIINDTLAYLRKPN